MRVLFITKQQYMAKDLLADRFGRFYEIPRVLGQLRHDLHGVCLRYWPGKTGGMTSGSHDFVKWMSFPLGRDLPLGFVRHYVRLVKIARRIKPDIVVGASDCFHIIMAARLGAKLSIPYAVDLYDNFEAYRATQIPGLRYWYRSAVSKAAAVSVISDTLLAKVEAEYRPAGIVQTVTNAVAPEFFHPGDKSTARRNLGLPGSGILIGSAGALNRSRDIAMLYRAFERVKNVNPRVCLVLAGPTDRSMTARVRGKAIYLSELPHERVGDLFRALDVGIVCNRDDPFGRYCFPQKLFEMLACKLPVVAADVGAIHNLLRESRACLYHPTSEDSLVEAILSQLGAALLPVLAIPTWRDRGLEFGALLEEAISASANLWSGIKAAKLTVQRL
jgi:teichuronic acid biosynthesis glycosyltransferase TuaC